MGYVFFNTLLQESQIINIMHYDNKTRHHFGTQRDFSLRAMPNIYIQTFHVTVFVLFSFKNCILEQITSCD